jgi:O-antigen/teichoic acid export membrane protein
LGKLQDGFFLMTARDPEVAPPPAGNSPDHRHVTVSQRLVAINAASSLVARLLNVTVLLWMYQYLLTRISPEEFAVYPVVTAVMVFAPLFFSLFTGGVSRHIIEAYAVGQTRRVAEIVSSILPLLGAASAAFLLIGLVGTAFVEDILKIAPGMEDDARLMLFLLVVSYALQMAMLPFTMGFHVRQRFVELNIIGVLRDLLRIALLLALLVGIGPSVLWVVVASVIAEQAHLAAVVVRSRQLVPEARFDSELFRWATARELVSFGLWTTVGQLANIIAASAGVLILNAYGSALDVTVYHLAATAFRQIQSVIVSAASPLLPALTAMHSLADRARLYVGKIFRTRGYVY